MSSATSSVMEVRAPQDAVASALLALGASWSDPRTGRFALARHSLRVEYDDGARSTTVSVVGDRSVEITCWLVEQLSELSPCLVLRS